MKKSSFYKPSFLVNNFETKDRFDYVIVGSSRALTALDTKQIDSSLNSNGLNLAMDDTGINSHYLMLLHFFNSGYKTNYCILNIDPWNTQETNVKLSTNDYRFVPFIGKTYVREYYKENEISKFGSLRWAGIFPIAAMSYYNLELFYPSLISILNPHIRNRFDNRGNYKYPDQSKVTAGKNSPKKVPLIMAHPYLKKIEEICKENNCKLLFYIAPIRWVNVDTENFSGKVINHSWYLADDKYFYDNLHVNLTGAALVTNELTKHLKGMMVP